MASTYDLTLYLYPAEEGEKIETKLIESVAEPVMVNGLLSFVDRNGVLVILPTGFCDPRIVEVVQVTRSSPATNAAQNAGHWREEAKKYAASNQGSILNFVAAFPNLSATP